MYFKKKKMQNYLHSELMKDMKVSQGSMIFTTITCVDDPLQVAQRPASILQTK